MEEYQWTDIKAWPGYSICKIGEKGGKIKCNFDDKSGCEFDEFDKPQGVHMPVYLKDGKIQYDKNRGTTVSSIYRHQFPEITIDGVFWKVIPGHEEYAVSRNGEIYSIVRQKKVALCSDKDGYLQFKFHKNGKRKLARVHRIVAKVFIPNDDPMEKTIVNHKNEDKTDNRVENLEWCTVE